MARKIYMTNLKGGTGVTTCCVGLGFALAELGERTLVVDGDSISGGALQTGGCANMQVYTLVDGLFDYILLDKTARATSDCAIIVTEPYVPSIKSADCCKAILSDGGIKDIGLIVNKLNGGQILSGEVMTAQEIASVLRLPLKAVIPEDLSLPVGKWKKSTMRAFRVAADMTTGKREGICNVLKSYFGLNGFIKRKVRERL